MKVGIWIDEHIDPGVGGGFSYFSKLIGLIDKHRFSDGIEVVFISYKALPSSFTKKVILLSESELELPFHQRLIYKFASKYYRFRKLAGSLLAKRNRIRNDEITASLRDHGIDILYYMSQMQQFVNDFPFITTNWDVAHLSMPPFPEITENGELKRRKVWYDYTLRKATSIFVESQAGKEELIDLVGIDPDKIKIVPLFPGGIVDLPVSEAEQTKILSEFDLEKELYFFYPAQFWQHKNHEKLVKAFALYHNKFPSAKLVFSGSDKGNLSSVFEIVKAEGLSDRVFHLGFISNEALFTLYRNAIALVMPTFLGPTNMPPLEAAALGCPVLCSDFKGHREQLEDGALYFDPSLVEEIKDALISIMDTELRTGLLQRARENLKHSKFTSAIALRSINDHFVDINKMIS